MKLVLAILAATGILLLVPGGGDGDRPRRAAPDAPEPRTDAPAPVRPAAPARYRVPRDAVRVSSGPGLRAALSAHRRRTIVLAPGTYDSTRPFLNPHGHRLYAARVGRAVLRAGLSLGGNDGRGGGLVRGVVVDVDDPGRTVDGAAIAVWGRGRASRILDTTVRGNGVVSAGVAARRPDGLVMRRVVARGFTDFGVLVDANEPDRAEPRERFRIEDLDVAGVGRPVPGSSDGTAEACVWIGDAGSVARVRARSCAWSGLWTGTATRRARFEAIDIDQARTGVYIEHFTSDSRFARLRIGRDVRIGLLAEWASPEWGGRPASVGNVIEGSRFASWLAGVYLDEGTTRTTIRRSTFLNQEWAAIGDYRGNANAYYANDYGGIDRGAEAIRHEHLAGPDDPR